MEDKFKDSLGRRRHVAGHCVRVWGEGFDRKGNSAPDPTEGTAPRRRQTPLAPSWWVGDGLDPCPVRRPLAAGAAPS